MYNRRVAGVVSGANGLSVGVVLGNLPGYEDAPPIAMSGRVWTLCDASDSAIEPGDLLTTSTTPGHAMKVIDYGKAQGAIIGKAMTSLSENDRGLVAIMGDHRRDQRDIIGMLARADADFAFPFRIGKFFICDGVLGNPRS